MATTTTPQAGARPIDADVAPRASEQRLQRALAGRVASRMRAQARERRRRPGDEPARREQTARPGPDTPRTYDSLGAFVGDDPRRELRSEHELGDFWLGDGFPPPAWRGAWMPATGELYIQRIGGVRPGGRVTVVAHFADESTLGERLAGWEDIAGTGGSVHWLLERLGIDDSDVPATAGAGAG